MNCPGLSVSIRLGFGLLMAMVAFLPSWTNGQPTTAPSVEADSKKAASTYCGVYCLYTILEMNGRHVPFQDLLKTEYIGSEQGSTMAQLIKAAGDYGFHAEAAANLTSRELRRSPYPIILHVKSSKYSPTYNHFVLCVSAGENGALIYDPPKPVERISFAELNTLWDGMGLIVSPTPINAGSIYRPTWELAALFVALMAIAAILWNRRKDRSRHFAERGTFWQRLGIAVIQCGQLTAIAMVVGILYHLLSNEGLLAAAPATDSVVQAHFVDFADKLDVGAVQQAIKENALIIDARITADYEAGHLPGAITIPIDLTNENKLKVLANTNVPKNARIVIYCQSDKCLFAPKEANLFRENGYVNIALFPGGWMDWDEHTKQRKVGG